jgi:hypothetical protein
MPIEATESFMSDNFPGNYTLFPEPPWARLIDIGPFYDRFAKSKMPILTSEDLTIKGIIRDLNIRQWVDLTRLEVIQAVNFISTIVPSLTQDLKVSVLTDPVTPDEQFALRKVFFHENSILYRQQF